MRQATGWEDTMGHINHQQVINTQLYTARDQIYIGNDESLTL